MEEGGWRLRFISGGGGRRGVQDAKEEEERGA